MLLDLGIRFISFAHGLSKLMPHCLQEEHLMEFCKRAFPRQDRILGFLKGARGGIAPHPLGACLEHVPDHAHRSLHACHKGLFGLRDIDWTVLTLVHDTATLMLGSIGRMMMKVSRVAYRALEL